MKKVVMIVALLSVSGLQAECYCKRKSAQQEQKQKNTKTKNPVKAVGMALLDGTVKVMETTGEVVKGAGRVTKKVVKGTFKTAGAGLDKLTGKK